MKPKVFYFWMSMITYLIGLSMIVHYYSWKLALAIMIILFAHNLEEKNKLK